MSKEYKISQSDKFIAGAFTTLAVIVYFALTPLLPFTAIILAALLISVPLDIFLKWFDNYFGSTL